MAEILITDDINKKPRDVVTAEEWNSILNKLIAQGNRLSTTLEETRELLDTLIEGGVVSVKINADTTTFGGKPPEEYVLAENFDTEIKRTQAFVRDTVGQLYDEVENIKKEMGL